MKYTTARNSQMCDECGKVNVKIWRVHNWHRYCVNCYARVFKRAMCLKCGNFARLDKYNKDAICSTCIRAKPCARCGKTEYRTGKLTPYGMVCNACAPHFRKMEPCDICGVLSNRLSKYSRLGNSKRICPKCARVDYGTCQACKRHRLLTLSNGKMLCKACIEFGEVPCEKCHQSMPAGYGKTCENCYWQGLLDKRTKINSAALLGLSAYFELFSSWLGQEVGVHKAAITVNKFLPFFEEIESQFNGIPDYEGLLNHFGAAKLRKVELPMRWLAFVGLIEVNAELREENTEKRRVQELLEKVGNNPAASKLINGYYQILKVDLKHRKTTLRSICLALSSAVSLLIASSEVKVMPPNQKMLDAYLKKSAGQRAAVSGFVNFLRDIHGVEIKFPKLDANKAQLNRRKKLEAEMLALMKAGKASADNREWLSAALAYFHGLPKKVGITVPLEAIVESNDGGIKLDWQGAIYWLQKP